jgi:hypothetical protein
MPDSAATSSLRNPGVRLRIESFFNPASSGEIRILLVRKKSPSSLCLLESCIKTAPSFFQDVSYDKNYYHSDSYDKLAPHYYIKKQIR